MAMPSTSRTPSVFTATAIITALETSPRIAQMGHRSICAPDDCFFRSPSREETPGFPGQPDHSPFEPSDIDRSVDTGERIAA